MGILGGTFNPPHAGHLALARDALRELRLELVLLVPTHTPPHKPVSPVPMRTPPREQIPPGPNHMPALPTPVRSPSHTPAPPVLASPAQRLAMCRLLAAESPGVKACALEIERGGASYTVDTLQEIHDANPDASLTLTVGADMALTLADWRRPQRLLELAELAIAERRPADRERVTKALAAWGAAGEDRIHFLSMRPIDVSSSLVRERIAAAEAVDGMLPASIARYVEEHGLYTSPSRA